MADTIEAALALAMFTPIKENSLCVVLTNGDKFLYDMHEHPSKKYDYNTGTILDGNLLKTATVKNGHVIFDFQNPRASLNDQHLRWFNLWKDNGKWEAQGIPSQGTDVSRHVFRTPPAQTAPEEDSDNVDFSQALKDDSEFPSPHIALLRLEALVNKLTGNDY